MKIAIGADHRGAGSARLLADRLKSQGHEITVLGTTSGETADYPDTAFAVGTEVASGRAEKGILIDGTGLGVSIAANKVRGIRAALVHDELTAEISRTHNDANVLALGARVTGPQVALDCLEAWLATPFEGGRHAARVAKLTDL